MSSLAQSSHSAKSETVLRLLRLWHKPHTKAIYSDVIVCELKTEPSFWAALCDRSPSCKWIALSLSLPLPLSPTSISFPKLVPSYKLIALVNSWKNRILVSVQASENKCSRPDQPKNDLLLLLRPFQCLSYEARLFVNNLIWTFFLSFPSSTFFPSILHYKTF